MLVVSTGAGQIVGEKEREVPLPFRQSTVSAPHAIVQLSCAIGPFADYSN